MAYFGPTGISGERMHPALRAYVDCFLSPPFPKMYPRGGGPWDQDPLLMRSFRTIRKFDQDWQESQSKMEAARTNGPFGGSSPGGGGTGMENALNNYIASLEE